MPIYVEIAGKSVELAITQTQQFLDHLDEMYRLIGKTLTTYVKQTITVQGRSPKWAPLSATTRMKTGRIKAFITLRDQIKYRSSNEEVVIFLDRDQSRWNIAMHAKGYTIPERFPKSRKAMAWQGRKGFIFARKARAAVVPPRSIYPSAKEASDVIAPVVDAAINDMIRKTWG